MLAVAVLSVAGCVSMPSGGPSNTLPANQNDTGQNQDYVGPFPAGPASGWNPEQIVQGFLFASASYYTASAIAAEYLTPAAAQTWNPGGSVTVFHTWNVSPPRLSANRQQAVLTVGGQVKATLNGNGQQLYASAAQGAQSAQSCQSGGQAACNQFTLVKSAGQWRIAKAPSTLLLDESDFERAWEPQDLYFFDSTRRTLIPDSVFVPLGTSQTDLLNKLAHALQAPPASWLAGSTASVFPPGVKINVTADPPSATVNLVGTHVPTDQATLSYMLAELVWTLTSPSVSQSAIQSVVLEINGSPVFPQGTQQNRETTENYDPYPSNPASFTYVDSAGVAQSRCGQTAGIGTAVALFGHSNGGQLASCPSAAAVTATPSATASAPPARPGHAAKPGKKNTASTFSMVAVSPDGKSVAAVSADHGTLSIGSFGGHSPLKWEIGPGSAITAISWDRQDNLWVAQGGAIWKVPMNGKPAQITFPGNVTALSVAPDGVRVAVIVQESGSSTSKLELAAINRSGVSTSQQPTPHGNTQAGLVFGTPAPLGPGITNSAALAWYDADNLIVLERTGAASGGQLAEVPVDGRAASQQLAGPPTPPGVTVSSIAAGNQANLLVAGLSNGQLEVSANFDGPWQSAGQGSQPAYLIPAAPPKGS